MNPRIPASREKLCIHTATTKPLPLEVAVDEYAAAGVAGITVWRDALDGRDNTKAGQMIRDAGLSVVSLCRGGFFVNPAESARSEAIRDNQAMVREAAALGAPLIVLVCGAHPEVPLAAAREQIQAGIEATLPLAEELGVKLAIEPLHPMYADTRSAVNSMKSANDLCYAIDHPALGVAVDVYHLWWDTDLESEIDRCGERVFAFHVCDWRSPTRDILMDRGLMGEGCIDIPQIRGWVEKTGFAGFNEVEIFSTEYWATNQRDYIHNIVTAYAAHV
ncbi:MAG: sugar phosphate isomerase/epimerase [Spirochaetales bacterium]|nr:MAG: sugar phosphate isomerase/epimerase [Spirochaetales bacterium]